MDQKKEIILTAAKETFSTFGYKGTSVDKIAKAAKVGKGTIYTYFETKEAMLLTIIDVIIEEMKKKADKVIIPEASLFENFHHSMLEILGFRKEHALLRMLAKEIDWNGTPLVANALKKIEKEAIDYLKALLLNAMNAKKMEACDPELTAFLIYKLYLAVVTEWPNHETRSETQLADILRQSVMHGLIKERSVEE